MPVKVSFLTTYSRDHPSRFQNLVEVIQAIYRDFPAWEIIIVEQGRDQSLQVSNFPDTISLVFAYNPGAFNKSWGLL